MEDRAMTEEIDPPMKRLNREAYEKGKEARLAGKPREECPAYARRSLRSDWERGWSEAIVTPHAVVRIQETVVVERTEVRPGTFWPKDDPLPETYQRQRRIVPCPKCLRRLLDDGSQVAVVRAINGGIVYLRCRQPGCGNQWKMRAEGT